MAGKSKLEEYADIVYRLNGYRRAMFRVGRLHEEILRWEAKAQKMTPSTSSVVSAGGAATPAVVLALEMGEEAEKRLEEAKEKMADKRAEIEKLVFSLTEENQQKVLYGLYIDLLKQHEIAEKLYYSKRQIVRIHQDALDELQRMSNNVT